MLKNTLIYIFFFFRPIPDREYVEGYIKAYYLPESQLEGWLPEHRVVRSKHTVNVEYMLTMACEMSKVRQVNSISKPLHVTLIICYVLQRLKPILFTLFMDYSIH